MHGLALWLAMGTAVAEGPRNLIVLVADGAGYNTFAAAAMYEDRWDARTETPAGQVYAEPGWVTVGKANSTLAPGPDAPPDLSRLYDPRKAWGRGGKPGYSLAKGGSEAYPYQHDSVAWHVSTRPDSAGTMTQMMTGVKTYNGSVNMGFGGQPLTAFSELVHETRGVGVVTSVPLDHATPAAAAGAHAVSRTQYGDIAAEILGGDVVDVWMGGGHPFYDHDGRLREPDWRYFGGPETWASAFDGRWRVIEARADFDALADPEVPSADAPSRILGLARVSDTLQYRRRVNRRGGGRSPTRRSTPRRRSRPWPAARCSTSTAPIPRASS
jgi:alkaline phosphatase